MFTVAAFILLTHADIPNDVLDRERDKVNALAAQLEILDLRFWTPFHSGVDQEDLGRLRQRLHYMADYPPLSDAERLPRYDDALKCVAFNEAFGSHLATVAVLYKANNWQIEEEVRRLHCIWVNIQIATFEYSDVEHRRRALHALREHLGDRYGGRWPDPVPVESFQEIR